MDTDKKLVLPGDEVGTTEEYIGGDGTYENNGKLFSSVTGVLVIDNIDKIVSVKPVTSSPLVLNVNDSIYGKVIDIRGSMAFVDIAVVGNNQRSIPTGGSNASLHVSKVTNEYLKDISRMLSIGDIIRAKVIQTQPSVQLDTRENKFGVVVSKCRKCNVNLEKYGKECSCTVCDTKYKKKTAHDYGKIEF